jgi:hypothetical protein
MTPKAHELWPSQRRWLFLLEQEKHTPGKRARLSEAKVNRTLSRHISNRELPQLPVNLDAERAIFGAILLGNSVYSQAENLAPCDFLLNSHRRIASGSDALPPQCSEEFGDLVPKARYPD